MESSVNSRLREWAFIARRRRRLLTELGGPVDIERVPALWPRTGTDGGRVVLGFYLFSLSMQKCGRNLMLVSQTDDPRLCPFPVIMKPASSLCRLPSFSSSSIISNPVKKTLYLMTSLVFAYLNHHFSWGQCFGISLFLSSAC